MKTSVEPLEENRVKVSVEVPADEFEPAVNEAFRRISREVRIPGFRPGKAPRKILEARLGAGFAREEALRESLPDFYAKALREHEVDAIAAPEIDVTDGHDDGPIAFQAVVEVRPSIELSGYQDLTVTVPSPIASDEEVDEQIDRLRGQHGELSTVSRPAIDGDHVTVDIAGSFQGEALEGLTADDYVYEVGAESVVPEIDVQLRGSKPGDILEFDAPHPDPDEDGSLRFRVLVKEVREKLLPEADDEFANEASEFDTIAELREDLAQRLAGMRAMQAQHALQHQVTEAIADLVVDEVPEAMVDGEQRARLEDLALRLRAQGVDFADYLQASGQNQEDLVAQLREQAAQAAKVDLALRAIAEAEGLAVEEDDVDRHVELMAKQFERDPEEIREHLTDGDGMVAVRSDLRKQKALDWLSEQVDIVDEDGQPVDRADLEPPPGEEEEGA